MITQYVKGDLLDAFRERKFDAIVHGCNCFHTMGAGIAAAIAKQFPVAYDADKLTQYGRDKRGGYTLAETPYGKIVNGYTQFNPGRADPKYLYTAIRTLFTKLDLILPSIIVGRPEVGIPKIGAGIHLLDPINVFQPDQPCARPLGGGNSFLLPHIVG